jgi:hypothetical protein
MVPLAPIRILLRALLGPLPAHLIPLVDIVAQGLLPPCALAAVTRVGTDSGLRLVPWNLAPASNLHPVYARRSSFPSARLVSLGGRNPLGASRGSPPTQKCPATTCPIRWVLHSTLSCAARTGARALQAQLQFGLPAFLGTSASSLTHSVASAAPSRRTNS